MKQHYTIIIQWSDEDQCYVVSLSEWGEFCHTHRDTPEEALKNAQEVLELLIVSELIRVEGDVTTSPLSYEPDVRLSPHPAQVSLCLYDALP